MTLRVSARAIAAAGAIALALGNVGRLPGGALGGRSSPLVAADLVVVAVWMMLLFALGSGRTRLLIDNVAGSATAFFLVACASTALAFSRYNLGGTDGFGVVAFLLRWLVYFGWYPFVAWCLTERESQAAWRDIELALLALCLFGIFQSAFFPGFAQMINAGGDLKEWDVQGRRLVSTLLDPNFAGVVIVIALLFRLARVVESQKESALAMVALSVGVLLTVSRSSILALAVGLGVLIFARGLKLRLLKVFFVGAVLLLPFLSVVIAFAAGFHKLGFDMSAAQRLVPWTRAIKLIAEHPVLGIGFNAIQPAQEAHGWRPIGGADISLDGGLLFVAAMTGLVGVALYIVMMACVWRAAKRAWRDTELSAQDRAHATATAASTIAVVVHSLFVNSLLLPFVMQILWVMWGRLAHISATRRARLGLPQARRLVARRDLLSVPSALKLAGMLAVLRLASACEPCAGTLSCTTTAHYEVTGTIVDHNTGAGIPGAQVEAAFNVQASVVNATATADKDGIWRLSADVPAAVNTTAAFTVTAPGHAPYTTPALPVHVVTTRGNADVMGQWTETPFARFLATVNSGGTALDGAIVTFTPTSSNVTLESSATAQANGSGIFEIDMVGTGDHAVGDFTISHPSLPSPIVVRGFSISLGFRFEIPHPTATIAVGAGGGRQLGYGGEVVFRGTGKNAPNVDVTYTRTGGIPTKLASVAVKSDATGFFVIDLQPLADGEVVGDLTLAPPSGAPVVYHDVRLATYDSTFLRSMGAWAYGDAWAWAVELWRFDSLKPAPGVGVAFHATGGLPIDSSRFQSLRTDANGRVELRGSVQDTGTVIGMLTVFPASGPPRTIPNVRLRTNPDDSLHFGGVFGFGPALRYVGEVLTEAGAPVVGAQVTWTQTSGIPATPNPLQLTTGADGRFPLTLFPSGDGEVVGTIRIRPPPPWAPTAEFVFTNLRLNSFESADVKLAVTYRLPPP